MAARILVIEDNPANLELMRYLLQAFGHAPLQAGDGIDGLETARREVPDLIICDVQLPRLDGYAVARQLKGDAALRGIPLLAVTAYAMVGDRDKLMTAGFDGYLVKPIVPETFVAQVEGFLPSGQRTTTVPSPASDTRVLKAAPSSVARHASILVVDNAPANLTLMRCLLEPLGYEVVGASSVAEAMACAQHTIPDLILSDLHMPEGGAPDFMRAIKADVRLASVPVLIISSTTWREQDRKEAIALGACQFLVRPIELEVLLAEIETCLRKRRKG
jgi:two-component system, cell cycle response regulator